MARIARQRAGLVGRAHHGRVGAALFRQPDLHPTGVTLASLGCPAHAGSARSAATAPPARLPARRRTARRPTPRGSGPSVGSPVRSGRAPQRPKERGPSAGCPDLLGRGQEGDHVGFLRGDVARRGRASPTLGRSPDETWGARWPRGSRGSRARIRSSSSKRGRRLAARAAAHSPRSHRTRRCRRATAV